MDHFLLGTLNLLVVQALQILVILLELSPLAILALQILSILEVPQAKLLMGNSWVNSKLVRALDQDLV